MNIPAYLGPFYLLEGVTAIGQIDKLAVATDHLESIQLVPQLNEVAEGAYVGFRVSSAGGVFEEIPQPEHSVSRPN